MTTIPSVRIPAGVVCPACRLGHLKPHGRYAKYHRERLIHIMRGICQVCGTTQTFIPCYSLSGSSHDADDVGGYLAARAQGLTRRIAGALILAGNRESRVLKRIERSFERCMRNWEAIFRMDIPTKHAYIALAEVGGAVAGTANESNVLLAANRYALERGVNAVFASRASILLFRSRNADWRIPHNPASAWIPAGMPDSS